MGETNITIRQSYNRWAATYDSMQNKTRDLEASALRESVLISEPLDDVLEIGCGTGKNTEWLLTKSKHLIAVGFSEEMLAGAKEKIVADNVEFRKLDLRDEWKLDGQKFDLVTCSLALEHIEDIDFVFGQVRKVLRAGGHFYIGELHPFKQYQGSKARFDTGAGVLELECFVHHISGFFGAGAKNNLQCVDLKEWFDDNDKTMIPRLLTMIFKKIE